MEYLRMSYSSGNVFESCPRKFELDKLYDHGRARDDAFAADVGTALHAGYQNYLVTQSEEKAIWAFLEKYPFKLEFMEQNDFRSCEASLATLEEMMVSHSMGDYKIAEIKRPLTLIEKSENHLRYEQGNSLLYPEGGMVVPAIEVPFEIRFEGIQLPPTPKYPEGCGVSFVGYMDAIMRNLLTDMYRTTDIKTHRDNINDRTAKYKFDTQQVPYGIVVDHIAGKAQDSFEVLYYDCKIDILEPRVKLYSFLKRQSDIQEWLLSRVLQLQAMQRYAEMDFFPRTSGGCMFYNRPCRYLEPCMSRDQKVLNDWFTLGKDEAKPENWEPWVVTTINPFG